MDREAWRATVHGVTKSQTQLSKHSTGGSVVKNLPASVGDTRDASLIPAAERSPGAENGNPLQYSYLENSMDKGA